jgi:hypothetical protein
MQMNAPYGSEWAMRIVNIIRVFSILCLVIWPFMAPGIVMLTDSPDVPLVIEFLRTTASYLTLGFPVIMVPVFWLDRSSRGQRANAMLRIKIWIVPAMMLTGVLTCLGLLFGAAEWGHG